MPDFPPPIQDLIQKMITVDPTQRIKMEEIKHHPAFYYKLPPLYILPTPIPVPDISKPLPAETLQDKQILKYLTQIGIPEPEIRTSLVAEGTNMVKLFYLMMSRKIQFDSYPWSQSHTIQSLMKLWNPPEKSPEPEIDPMIEFDNFGPNTVKSQLKSNHDVPFILSPDVSSLATRQLWLQEEPGTEFDYESDIGATAMTLPNLMYELEKIMFECGFEFFHPDDMTLIGKLENKIDKTSENESYMELNVKFTTVQCIKVHLSMKNVTMELKDTVNTKLHEILSDFLI